MIVTNEQLIDQAFEALTEQLILMKTCLNSFYTAQLVEQSRKSSAAITELHRRACVDEAQRRKKD